VTSDEQSAERLRAEEFTKLYSPCERQLYVYIVTVIGNPLDAYDVLQDANLVLWQKFDQFERGTNFFAWAREVARYRSLQYRRLHAGSAPLIDQKAFDELTRRLDSFDDCADQLYSEALPDCIDQLSDGDRELIQLRYTEGVSVQLLAKRLNRSENAVSQSLGRIRRLLRKCVEDAVRQKTVKKESV
jgi:RNA polymerase sigma-70 factor, ECF subfamily